MAGLVKLAGDIWGHFVEDAARDAQQIIANPMADPVKTVVLGGIMLGALLLIVFILAAIRSAYRQDRGGGGVVVVVEDEDDYIEPEEAERPSEIEETPEWERVRAARRKAALGWALFLIIVLTAYSGADWYAAQPAFCPTCHIHQPNYLSWKDSSHKTVGCLGCHEAPGATGYAERRLKYASEAINYLANRHELPLGNINNKACLKCHTDVADKTLVKYNIRVRHKDFLGLSCSDCHSQVGHGGSARLKTEPGMNPCLRCHNNQQASANCNVCHVKDYGEKMRLPKRTVVKQMVPAITNCRGCHSVKKCTDHHGTEMPHQEPKWMRDVHGLIAGASNEPFCWRCHPADYSFCVRCHSGALAPHSSDWLQVHRFVVWGQREHALRKCKVCHDSVLFCRGCHEPSGNGDGPAIPNLEELLNAPR